MGLDGAYILGSFDLTVGCTDLGGILLHLAVYDVRPCVLV